MKVLRDRSQWTVGLQLKQKPNRLLQAEQKVVCSETMNLTYRAEVCKPQGRVFRSFTWRGGSKWIFSTKWVPKPLFTLKRVTAVSPKWLEWIMGLGKIWRPKVAYRSAFTWKVQEKKKKGEKEKLLTMDNANPLNRKLLWCTLVSSTLPGWFKT